MAQRSTPCPRKRTTSSVGSPEKISAIPSSGSWLLPWAPSQAQLSDHRTRQDCCPSRRLPSQSHHCFSDKRRGSSLKQACPSLPWRFLRPTHSTAHSLVLLETLSINYVSGKLAGKRSKMSDQKEIPENNCSFWGSSTIIPTLTVIITTLCLSGNSLHI